MKVEITKKGKLKIIAEDTIDVFALNNVDKEDIEYDTTVQGNGNPCGFLKTEG